MNCPLPRCLSLSPALLIVLVCLASQGGAWAQAPAADPMLRAEAFDEAMRQAGYDTVVLSEGTRHGPNPDFGATVALEDPELPDTTNQTGGRSANLVATFYLAAEAAKQHSLWMRVAEERDIGDRVGAGWECHVDTDVAWEDERGYFNGTDDGKRVVAGICIAAARRGTVVISATVIHNGSTDYLAMSTEERRAPAQRESAQLAKAAEDQAIEALRKMAAAVAGPAMTVEPRWAGPAADLPGTLHAPDLDRAELERHDVSFGDGISVIGRLKAVECTHGGDVDIECRIRVDKDATLGRREVKLTGPDGREATGRFDVHPLVVVIDIDGLRLDVFEQAVTGQPVATQANLDGSPIAGTAKPIAPNLAGLFGKALGERTDGLQFREHETGVSLLNPTTVFPSYTFPSQATIVTGVEPGVHGIVGNAMFDRMACRNYAFDGGESPLFDGGEDAAFFLQARAVYTEALADRTIRKDTPTMYEELAEKRGVGESVVGYHMYGRGVPEANWLVPGDIAMVVFQPANHTMDYDWAGYFRVLSRLDDLLPEGRIRERPPELCPSVVFYYVPGLDHFAHIAGGREASLCFPYDLDDADLVRKQMAYLEGYADPLVGVIRERFEKYPGTVFVVTNDHGQSDVSSAQSINWPHLQRIFENSDFRLWAKGDQTWASRCDLVIRTNGGLAHVYVNARSHTDDPNCGALWNRPPALERVIAAADRIASASPEAMGLRGYGPWYDTVLVKNAARDGWDGPYYVYTPPDEYDDSPRLTDLVTYLQSYHDEIGGRLGWRRQDAEFLAERINSISCDRSGDVIVIPHYPPPKALRNRGEDYYYFDGPLFGQHGGLSTDDMRMPFAIAQPGSTNRQGIIDLLKGTVRDLRRPRITDIAPTICALAGHEFRPELHRWQKERPPEPPDTWRMEVGLRSVTGDSRICAPGGEWELAVAGTQLAPGTQLKTGPDGTAEVLLAPTGAADAGHVVVLRPNTGVELEGATVRLASGEVRATSAAATNDMTGFSISTPLATITPIGTDFTVTHAEQPEQVTAIRVAEGRVNVIPSIRSVPRRELGPGEWMRIPPSPDDPGAPVEDPGGDPGPDPGDTPDPAPDPGPGALALSRIEVTRSYPDRLIDDAYYARYCPYAGDRTYSADTRSFRVGYDFRWPEDTRRYRCRGRGELRLERVPEAVTPGENVELAASVDANWQSSGMGHGRQRRIVLGLGSDTERWDGPSDSNGFYDGRCEAQNSFAVPQPEGGAVSIPISVELDHAENWAKMEMRLIYGRDTGAEPMVDAEAKAHRLTRFEIVRTYPNQWTDDPYYAQYCVEPGESTGDADQRAFDVGWSFMWPEQTQRNLCRGMARVTLDGLPDAVRPDDVLDLTAGMAADWDASGYGNSHQRNLLLEGSAGKSEWKGPRDANGAFQGVCETGQGCAVPLPENGEIAIPFWATITFQNEWAKMQVTAVYSHEPGDTALRPPDRLDEAPGTLGETPGTLGETPGTLDGTLGTRLDPGQVAPRVWNLLLSVEEPQPGGPVPKPRKAFKANVPRIWVTYEYVGLPLGTVLQTFFTLPRQTQPVLWEETTDQPEGRMRAALMKPEDGWAKGRYKAQVFAEGSARPWEPMAEADFTIGRGGGR